MTRKERNEIYEPMNRQQGFQKTLCYHGDDEKRMWWEEDGGGWIHWDGLRLLLQMMPMQVSCCAWSHYDESDVGRVQRWRENRYLIPTSPASVLWNHIGNELLYEGWVQRKVNEDGGEDSERKNDDACERTP
jgi:hypothetical protein